MSKKDKRGLASADKETRTKVATLGGHARAKQQKLKKPKFV